MSAEREIHDALLRYCRGIDRMDADLVRSAYHDDAVDDHGDGFRGSVEDYVPWVMDVLAERFTSTMHTLSNVTIELHDNTAWVESYLVAHHVVAGTGAVRTFGARYVDEFAWRPSSGWRIASRRLVPEWQVENTVVVAVPTGTAQPTRDGNDPSYDRERER